jgi:hypothetical protein
MTWGAKYIKFYRRNATDAMTGLFGDAAGRTGITSSLIISLGWCFDWEALFRFAAAI